MNRTRRLAHVVIAGVLIAAPAIVSAQHSEAAGLRTVVPFSVGRFDVGLGGSVHHLGTPVGTRTPFGFESTIRLPFTSRGFWLGTSVEGAREVDSIPVSPLLSAGFWQTIRDVRVSVGAYSRTARLGGRAARTWTVPGRDSTIPTDTGIVVLRFPPKTYGDSGSPSRAMFWSDLEARVSGRLGATSLEAVVGTRARVQTFAPALWGRVGVHFPLSTYLALSAAVGTEPPRITLGIPASRFASIALGLRPWRTPSHSSDLGEPASLVVRRDSASSYRLTFVSMSAKSVEISGDFARWHPVELRETRPGVWETTLAIEPGTYHVNVRIDGGRWIAPPGLPQTDDDFNGAVGVLVVR